MTINPHWFKLRILPSPFYHILQTTALLVTPFHAHIYFKTIPPNWFGWTKTELLRAVNRVGDVGMFVQCENHRLIYRLTLYDIVCIFFILNKQFGYVTPKQ